MHSRVKKRTFSESMMSLAALALVGCGGGDGETAEVETTPPAQNISVEGSAHPISADPLSVVFVAHTSTSTAPAFQTIASARFPQALQKATSGGAYTEIGVDANSLISLHSGKIVEVAGNGEFAIGRWTDGSTSFGKVGPNHGDHYAIGRPLTIPRVLGPDETVRCVLEAATSPTSSTMDLPPGHLLDAVAIINRSGPIVQETMLTIRIGNDDSVTVSAGSASLSGVMLSQGSVRQIQTIGSDETRPYLAIGYVVPTPNSGDVAGLAVLKCTEHAN